MSTGPSELVHNGTASTSSHSQHQDVGIRAIDSHSVHRITSGQVVIDLQTAVKELVENSLDAGATNIEVRFQNYGLKAIEVIDNGSGIASKDYDSIALKHYTSKLASFEDLSKVLTFGFRGEALSSLCALCDSFTVTTATADDAPMGTFLEMDSNGKVISRHTKVARQRGTTVTATNLFKRLPVRRKEFERNAKREYQKALNLLYAYALVPCAKENKGVRFTATNQTDKGRKLVQLKTDGTPSTRASVTALWGRKALENVVDLNLSFDVETEKAVLRRQGPLDPEITTVTPVKVHGLISKFTVGAGRSSSDRQYFFVNGRPCNPGKVQKAINEVYRTFNANQSPFVIADFILPTHACDINVSPDKRTIFLHSENSLVQALKLALEESFSSSRSTYDVRTQPTQQKNNAPVAHPLKGPTIQDAQQSHSPLEKADNVDALDEEISAAAREPRAQEEEAITMGVPRLLLESEQHGSRAVDSRPFTSREDDGVNGDRAQSPSTDRPRSRAPSEPLFFPGSEDEGTAGGRPAVKEKGSGTTGPTADHPRPSCISATGATSASSAPRTINASNTSAPTHVINKPRSIQTVLNTRGAVWNVRRSSDDIEEGRERKRARLSGTGKANFKSSLSQYTSAGSRAPTEKGDAESEDEPSECEDDQMRHSSKADAMEVDEEEVDELAHDEPIRPSLRKARSAKSAVRSRAGSVSSQGTVVVASDDEDVMEVDGLPPANSKSSRRAAHQETLQSEASTSHITRQSEDVVDLTDDWDISPTLVGTCVPEPKGKETSKRSTNGDGLYEKGPSVTLHVDLVSIGSFYLDLYRQHSVQPAQRPTLASTSSPKLRSAVESANLENAAADNVASAALSRIISKSDFQHMQVIGQFNLGFIIIRKRISSDCDGEEQLEMDDLFIVDQHAADEKWNFETLQDKTVIESQRLFRPRPLQLTAADEMLAVENIEILKRNGFEVAQMNESEHSASEEESTSPRLHLVAQPVSKDTVFDMKDLEELIHLMQDRPAGTMVRCSKARAMFAMRACRRSVMIGKALDKPRMTNIVRHMGTMDQPWNCPHGRPTMRHLSDLRSFGRYNPPKRAIDWEAFGTDGSEAED